MGLKYKKKPLKQKSDWRESYDYRAGYIRKNPGIYGGLWFCSQCGKPLIGRKQVVADHMFPASRFILRTKNGKIISDALAKAMNTSLNITGICESCNLMKSNKMGYFAFKGVLGKSRELSAKFIGDTVALGISVVWIISTKTIDILTKPVRSKRVPVTIKLVVLLVYAAVIYLLFF